MANTWILVTLSLIAISFGLVSSAEDNTFRCNGKSCKSFPADCTSISCDLGVMFELVNTNDSTVTVHAGAIAANPNSYVAVGFSKDGLMGNDAVFMCIPNKPIMTMVNPPDNHQPPVAKKFLAHDPSGSSSFKSGRVDCTFNIPRSFDAGNGMAFKLNEETANVLVVTGLVNQDGVPQHHSNKKVIGTILAQDLGSMNASAGWKIPSTAPDTSTTTTSTPSPSAGSTMSTNAKILGFMSSVLMAAFAILH